MGRGTAVETTRTAGPSPTRTHCSVAPAFVAARRGRMELWHLSPALAVQQRAMKTSPVRQQARERHRYSPLLERVGQRAPERHGEVALSRVARQLRVGGFARSLRTWAPSTMPILAAASGHSKRRVISAGSRLSANRSSLASWGRNKAAMAHTLSSWRSRTRSIGSAGASGAWTGSMMLERFATMLEPSLCRPRPSHVGGGSRRVCGACP